MKQKSSARAPKLGNNSEIILPDFPRGLKSQKGLAMFPDGPSKVTAGIPGGFLPILNEFGLVIKSIDMTDRTGTKDNEYLFGRPFEMSIPGSVGIVGINVRPDGFFAGEAGRVIRRKKPVFA